MASVRHSTERLREALAKQFRRTELVSQDQFELILSNVISDVQLATHVNVPPL